MPIRPENKARYPDNWQEIRASIIQRSQNRCECTGQCGRYHLPAGMTPQTMGDFPQAEKKRCFAMQYEPHPRTNAKVVLTIAHLDHQPENNDPDNLRAMCQRCHNMYDAPNRTRNRRANQDRASGQELLPFAGKKDAQQSGKC